MEKVLYVYIEIKYDNGLWKISCLEQFLFAPDEYFIELEMFLEQKNGGIL